MGKGKEEGQFSPEAIANWRELQRRADKDDTQPGLGEAIMDAATKDPNIIYLEDDPNNTGEQ